MDRRSKSVSGWVNFPVNDSKYEHTQEGGMVVKLIVLEDADSESDFSMCFGASPSNLYGETVVGSDKGLKEQDLYPNIFSENNISEIVRSASVPLLASVTLGTTGWSGYDNQRGDYWICQYEDLTREGKALYDQLGQLYGNHHIHLITVLDT